MRNVIRKTVQMKKKYYKIMSMKLSPYSFHTHLYIKKNTLFKFMYEPNRQKIEKKNFASKKSSQNTS